MGSALESGARRQSEDFNNPGVSHAILNTERVAHGAGDNLKLGLILGRKRDEHHEEAHQQTHQIGKGDEPPVTATVTCFLPSRHRILSRPPLSAATVSAPSPA